MALRFIDGFDADTATTLGLKWTSAAASPTLGAGRFGGNSWTPPSSTSSPGLSKTIDSQATWVVGAAVKFTAVNALTVFALLDSGTSQCDIRSNSSGFLLATRNGTTLGTSTATFSAGVWYYVEFKATIHPSAGTVDIHVNGVSWLSLTGQNTKTSSNSTANQINVFVGSGFTTATYDDLYICDGTGSANNTFLGDVRVEAIKPAGAGNHTQFTPNGAGANYNCVNESSMDGDTTYNSGSIVGDIDTFTFGTLSSTPVSVMGVQTSLFARKDDAGSHTVAPLFRSGGTDYAQTAQSVSSSYACLLSINETDPSTSAAWTASAINAIEAGYKLVS